MDNLQPNFYANIPAFVRYDEDLKANAKLLYGEITALTSMKGYCWATNSYFANLYKVDPNTISRWVSQLVKKGYVVLKLIYKEGTKEIKERRLYLSNAHFIKEDEDEIVYTKKSTPIDEKVDTPIDEKVKDITTSFITTLDNNKADLEKSTEVVKSDKPKRKKKKKEYPKELLEQCEEFKNHYNSYERLKNRSEARGMSDTRIEMFQVLLEEFTKEDIKEAIDKLACSNDWLLSNTWFNFNWCFEKRENFLAVLEGKHIDKQYLNHNTNKEQQTNQYKPVNEENLFRDC